MPPESRENDVSNDILSERKYFQLFTHESNTFLLNSYIRQTDLPTPCSDDATVYL